MFTQLNKIEIQVEIPVFIIQSAYVKLCVCVWADQGTVQLSLKSSLLLHKIKVMVELGLVGGAVVGTITA